MLESFENSENKFYSAIEDKIKEEYDRRNNAKIMLQAILVHRVRQKVDNNLAISPSIGKIVKQRKDSVACLGKLPNYSRSPKVWVKDMVLPNPKHWEGGSSLKQKLKGIFKKQLKDKVNNQIMQKEYMDQLRRLELSVLRDSHINKLTDEIIGDLKDKDCPLPNFSYPKFHEGLKALGRSPVHNQSSWEDRHFKSNILSELL